GKNILVPDFICQVVIDVLLELEMNIVFYTVHDNFEFSLPKNLNDISALYLVKYFGHASDSFNSAISSSSIPLIIDDVFGVHAPVISPNISWGYFNSLRKITQIADFSYVVTNIPLVDIDKKKLSCFAALKYQGKNMKFNFIYNDSGNESEYLECFNKSERIINDNVGIFYPEDKSIYLVGKFQENYVNDRMIRLKNLAEAERCIARDKKINVSPDYPSFFPVLLNQREKVRGELMKRGIYLAVHWPNTNQIRNNISDRIISVPLDSRYNSKDILRICDLINQFDD
ncbi:hypothetical protein OFN39_25850, partial [Escherichia coli]|nr:hypothetical protein [Escherichia coli]